MCLWNSKAIPGLEIVSVEFHDFSRAGKSVCGIPKVFQAWKLCLWNSKGIPGLENVFVEFHDLSSTGKSV